MVYICENVFVPLRSGPSHKSEMLSQVLFGERYKVIGEAGTWSKVETIFDNYTGWIDNDHLQHGKSESIDKGEVLNKSLACFKPDGSKLVLEPGCEIFRPDFKKHSFMVGSDTFTAPDEFSQSWISTSEEVTDTAMRFINSPYIWGGRIPSGIDCSGLTQLAYKIHGIPIPRDANKQAEIGVTVNLLNEARPGDLAFFSNTGNISHVGMILSEGLIIHASGRVRIDTIDHQGIFKPETGKYSHQLRLIKRVII